MDRPKILHVGGVLYWTIRIRNPDTEQLKDADSTPSVAIRKNGAATGDSVSIVKRASTTGIYDCSYDPSGEVEGDEFTVEETATVTGTPVTGTPSATYEASWEFTVVPRLDDGLVRGVVGAGSSVTSINVSSVDSGLAVVDQLKGRVLIFNKNTTTAALRGQGAPIAGNSLSAITVAVGDAFTTSPVAGDTFTIY